MTVKVALDEVNVKIQVEVTGSAPQKWEPGRHRPLSGVGCDAAGLEAPV